MNQAHLNPAHRPRLLFFRMIRPDLPAYVRLHLQEQVKCLSQFFDVTVIAGSCDYAQVCEKHRPQLCLFESGVYVGPRKITNTSAHAGIPKLGFCHCDAYCVTREVFISDMAAWGVENFFTLSVSLASYTPALADKMFVWPNFIDPEMFHDYGQPKVIPVLFTGSQAPHYPWRNGINRIISQHYPTLQSPHFGWFNEKATARMPSGQAYARLLNAAMFAPACGTIAKEVVRKHFEIPASNTCLITQRTPALEAAGFVDQVNCVFADDTDVLDKLDWLFEHPDERQRISQAGHDLVHARHTIQVRDQIYQWFRLHQQLQPHQRIIQPGPFLPLTIVDRASGITNGHVPSSALDRKIMAMGDEHFRAGRYDEAETCYYQCLNYHQMPEPRLGLVRCCLFTGKAALAARLLWEQIRGLHVGHANTEPDPVEWAYFIVALLCLGKTDEAVVRAGQFELLRHPELDRVRAVVAALFAQSGPFNAPIIQAGCRYSLSQLPDRTMEMWLHDLRKMLQTGRQSELAARLAAPDVEARIKVAMEAQAGHASSPAFPARQALSTVGGAKEPAGISPWDEFPPVKKPVKWHVKLLAWIRCQGGRVKRRSLRLARAAANRIRPVKPLPPESNDLAGIIRRMLSKENIQSGLLIGAADETGITEAFLAGMEDNPNKPSAVCVSISTSGRFRKLQKRLAENARVDCRRLLGDRPWTNNGGEPFDAVVIDGSELPVGFQVAGPLVARFVVLNDISASHIFNLCQTLLANRDYTLSVHNPLNQGGYAVFSRIAKLSGSQENSEPQRGTDRCG